MRSPPGSGRRRFRSSSTPWWIFYLRGDYAAALPMLQTAANGLPDVPVVQYHLAMALKQTGQREASIERLRRAVSLAGPIAAPALQQAQSELTALLAEIPQAETQKN